MSSSGLFSDSKPIKPHLVRPNGGLSGEIYGLRKDILNTFSSLCAFTTYDIRNPPAADTAGILLPSIPSTSNTSYVRAQLNGTVYTDHITFPDSSFKYPRNITATTPLGATGWVGSVVVTGFDVSGNLVQASVPIANGSTSEPVAPVTFVDVTNVFIPAQAGGATGTLSVGFGNTIGLDRSIYYRDSVPSIIKEKLNGVDVPAGDSTFYPSSTTAPLGGYLPDTVPNGINSYLIYYEFDSNQTVDTSHLISPPSATPDTPGTEQSILYFDPSGTWSDGQRLQVLLDQEAAGLKREIWFKPGATYYINVPVSIPSYTTLRLRGCKVVSSITISDGITTDWIAGTKSTFYCGATFGTGEALFFSAIGSDTPQVTVTNSIDATTPPIGVNSKICIFQGRDASFYTVKEKVVSGSNYTLTLDRAPYTNFNYLTAKIKPVTYSPEKIQIIGDGAVFSGTGDWAIWLTGAYLSKIQGCKVDDSVGVYGSAIGFGTAGRRNIIQECEVSRYGGGSSVSGVGVMFNEDSVIEKCGMYAGAIAITGGLKNTVRDSVVHNSSVGFHLHKPNLVTTSGRGNSFYNVKAINCSIGIAIWGADASCRPTDTTVVGAYVEAPSFSGGYGILVGDGVTNTLIDNCVIKLTQYSSIGTCLGIQAATNTTVLNCTFYGGLYGAYITGVGSQTNLRDVTTKYAGSIGVLCAHSGSSFNNVKALSVGAASATGFSLTAPADSVTAFNNIEVSISTTTTSSSGFAITGGGNTAKYIIDGYRCNLDAVNSTAIRSILSGPALSVKDLTITASASAGRYAYYFNTAACTVRLSGRQDTSAVATAKFGGSYSRGTVVLTGNTPVTYAFADVNGMDTVTLTRKVVGTPSTARSPTWSIIPGTGISVVSETVACSDTYEIQIC